jgi:hypothetical protein
MVTRKLEENIRQMNALTGKIIHVSNQQVEFANANLKYRVSSQRKQINDKNGFVSELMTVIADCRKMKLNQADKATLDTTITRLNERLYEATSLIIL